MDELTAITRAKMDDIEVEKEFQLAAQAHQAGLMTRDEALRIMGVKK